MGQQICKEFEIAFIVDEVQTGVGASGQMWAHEAWGLESPPDFVCFSKKTLLGGYYYKDEFQPPQGYRVFNTWMGGMTKVLLFKAVLQTIKEEGLIEQSRQIGQQLTAILETASKTFPEYICNLRGVGTIVAFDCASPKLRDELMTSLRNNGVLVGTNGTQSIRFRPSPTFGPAHMMEFQQVFDATLRQLSSSPEKRAVISDAIPWDIRSCEFRFIMCWWRLGELFVFLSLAIQTKAFDVFQF